MSLPNRPRPLSGNKGGLDLPLFVQGKVRDVYDLGPWLLIVASDRISAFDHVLPTPIPSKGAILNQLSAFWFRETQSVVPNHLLTTDVLQYPQVVAPFRDWLTGRSMLVRKTEKINMECVVRGYLAGSGWKDYRTTGAVCGIPLPKGLRESEQLPEPIFTPATKESGGKHDENISFKRMQAIIGRELAERLRTLSLAIFQQATVFAKTRGLLLADTKFEFGVWEGQVLLIDELLTPDSSRFWDQATYAVGRSQDSFDKQFVRDYLESLGWNKRPPIPPLPPDVVQRTQKKYLEAYERLVGSPFR
ncbi:MAG: phosphoribosylaminoimidazolesuccinocarboxamide synthase [Elusimicrobia bacterium]|nr:phosphoribosylaminoimidazolesuccinocarboxamide synthase [Elusimicrobiota bacterium]